MKEKIKNFGNKVIQVMRDFFNMSLNVSVTASVTHTTTTERELIDNSRFLIDYDTMKDNSFNAFKSNNDAEIEDYEKHLEAFFKRHGDYIKNLDIKFVKDKGFLDEYDVPHYVKNFYVGDITSDTHIRLILSEISHLYQIRITKHLSHISENGKWNENGELEDLEVYTYNVVIIGALDDDLYSV